MLAWLDGEQPASTRVEQEIASRPVMSWINLCEVYHRLIRDHGQATADDTLAELRPQLAEELPTVNRFRQAARLKAQHTIALADCFAIATAAAHDATLLTGDPEILHAPGLPCTVEDLHA